jgi:hypothetical protein
MARTVDNWFKRNITAAEAFKYLVIEPGSYSRGETAD